MRQRTNIGGDAARMARSAASDLASLQRAMRAAQSTLDGLHLALKVPNVTPRRQVIKGSRTAQPLLFTFLGKIAGSYLAGSVSDSLNNYADGNSDTAGSSSAPSSFYRSAGQASSDFLKGVLQGKRIL